MKIKLSYKNIVTKARSKYYYELKKKVDIITQILIFLLILTITIAHKRFFMRRI